MLLKGVSLDSYKGCVSMVSRQLYAGNVIVNPDASDLQSRTVKDEAGEWFLRCDCRARLAVTDSRGHGSRTSASGRHGRYACWHAYRDVLAEVFRRWPGAEVTAGHGWRVTYRGRAGFEELFPETGHVNIGSQVSPVTMPELCECPAELYPAIPSMAVREASTPGLTEEQQQLLAQITGSGLLECPECGRRNGQYSSQRTLDAHLALRHPAVIARRHAQLDWPVTQNPVLRKAREQEAEAEALLDDPVFGPPVAPGTTFRW